MNFFEHQDQARRNTTQLVALFFLAIAVMIVAVYLIIILTVRIVAVRLPWWQPSLFLLISLVMLSIIGFGSLTKMFELRRGGSVVATSLGGQQLNPQTNDAKEMQLLNVVAEMALASGTPIPPVYLLSREPGINAFAAGYTPDDAVIGIITDGDLRRMLEKQAGREFTRLTAADVMSPAPKSIDTGELAVRALEIMRSNSITQLLVTENGNYVGVVHLHDLIREGLV